MGLYLRSSSLANPGNSITISPSALAYNQADGNFMYLLTNMSGSAISITGSTGIVGTLTTNGGLTVTNGGIVARGDLELYKPGGNILQAYDLSSPDKQAYLSTIVAGNSGVLGLGNSGGGVARIFANNVSPGVVDLQLPDQNGTIALASNAFPYTGSAMISGTLDLQSSATRALSVYKPGGAYIEVYDEAQPDRTAYIGASAANGGYLGMGNGTYYADILATNITANRTYQLPNQNGTIALASNAFPYTGSAIISGSLLVTGSLNISGSQIFNGASISIGNQILTGSLSTSGSNTLIGNTTLSGSINVSGSQTFYGTSAFYGNHTLSGSNTITGNTIMSGSIEVSGSSNFKNSTFIVTGSSYFKGTHEVSGSTNVTGALNITGDLNVISGSGFYRWGNKLFNYAQFANTASITVTQNVSGAFALPLTYFGDGISIISGSRITFANTGLYNIQFSTLATQGNASATAHIWFRKTGSNIDNSDTSITLQNNTTVPLAWNFLYPFSASEYAEILYHSNSTVTSFTYAAAGSGFPASPSVIVTVTQVA